MKKIFEFVKVGGTWYYWLSGGQDLERLSISRSFGKLLETLDDRYVKLQTVDLEAAEVSLEKIRVLGDGLVCFCKSKRFNEKLPVPNIVLSEFEEVPQNIYLKKL